MSVRLYGIKNCDTVRKARRWLDDQQIEYEFHDFRESGLARKSVEQWIDAKGWENVLNRRSTSWKTLDASLRDAMDVPSAVDAAIDTPTLIKRPVLETKDALEFGFRPDRYTEILLASA